MIVTPKIESRPAVGKPRNEGQFKRQTRADVERELRAKVAAIRSLIRDHVVYIDTAIFLAKQPVMPSLRAELRDTGCGHIAYLPSRCMQWPYRLDIQHPTHDTLTCLAETVPGHKLSSFHLALDCTTASPEHAHTLARELSCTVTLRWRGNSKTGRSFDTFYAAARKVRPTITARRTRRNLAIYTRGPVAHFEARYTGAALCEGRGLLTAADLRNNDLTTMLERDCRFSAVNWRAINGLIEYAARYTVRQTHHDGQTVAAVKQQLLDEIMTAINQQAADVTTQDILDAHYLLRHRKAAVHLPFSILAVPPRAHAQDLIRQQDETIPLYPP